MSSPCLQMVSNLQFDEKHQTLKFIEQISTTEQISEHHTWIAIRMSSPCLQMVWWEASNIKGHWADQYNWADFKDITEQCVSSPSQHLPLWCVTCWVFSRYKLRVGLSSVLALTICQQVCLALLVTRLFDLVKKLCSVTPVTDGKPTLNL